MCPAEGIGLEREVAKKLFGILSFSSCRCFESDQRDAARATPIED